MLSPDASAERALEVKGGEEIWPPQRSRVENKGRRWWEREASDYGDLRLLPLPPSF
jgi:hypothetical protein